MVEEQQNAWHAGISQWQEKAVLHPIKNKLTLNYNSFGIEIVNETREFPKEPGSGVHFEHFQEHQIKAVISKCQEIIKHYNIHATCVVGHSDIALNIGRKSDPGPLFPWKALALAGVGAWYDEKVEYLANITA